MRRGAVWMGGKGGRRLIAEALGWARFLGSSGPHFRADRVRRRYAYARASHFLTPQVTSTR